MASKISAGMKLRCKDGHWEWSEFELKTPPGTPGGAQGSAGYWMMVHCDYGEHKGHWLAPDPLRPGRVIHQGTPYAWLLATEAFAARDRYAAQVAKDFD